ncbi:MAG: arsenate reductase family protein [Firmicutes bacterium]|nr:arsenate reductase family protein [Bacillota bacterium]
MSNYVIIFEKGGKNMLYINYSKCGTCKKAKAWLDANDIKYIDRPIKEENPTLDELKTWHKLSGLPLKKFFNTSGLLYKSLELKDKLPKMTDEEMYELLASDGMLVKRPIVVKENLVLVGFKEAEWEQLK